MLNSPRSYKGIDELLEVWMTFRMTLYELSIFYAQFFCVGDILVGEKHT